jgi:O6-methylguanine-DNA--protein-cysteine methyltransferase
MVIFDWLKSKGYEYTWGVKLGGGKPDIVAFNSSEIVALEFKKADMDSAVSNCLKYLKEANRAYILTKTDTPSTIPKKHGIGLIRTNHGTKLILEAKLFQLDKDRLDKLLDALKSTSMSVHSGNNFRQRIVEILRQHPEGMTIMDIAARLKAHRHTAAKYVRDLIKEGLVMQRNIGPAKLCYLEKGESRSERK